MIKDALAKLADRADLSEPEAEAVMAEMMDGAATPSNPSGRPIAAKPRYARTSRTAAARGFVT